MNWDIISEFEQLRALRGEWCDLAQRSEWRHIMGSPDWITCWWNTLARRDSELAAIVIRDGAQLSAVLPMMTKVRSVGRYAHIRRLQPVGTGRSDYLFPLYAGDPAVVADAILDACASLQHRWDEVWFCQFPTEAPLTVALQRALAIQGYEVRSVPTAGCPIVDTTGSYEEYFAGRNSQLRQNCRTQINKLTRAGLAPSVQCQNALTPELKNEMRAIESDKKHGRSLEQPGFSRFLDELFAVFGPRGECEIWTALLDGKPESFAITVADGRTRGWWHIATSARGSDFSLGTYLLRSVIETTFQQGYREFDFLRGTEPYKMRWSTGVRELACFGALSKSLRTRMLLRGNLGLHRLARQLAGKANQPAVLVEEFGDA